MIKGSIDFIAEDGEIGATINEPNIPTLEPIGGTGDATTGIVSALIYAGYMFVDDTIYAAKVNRFAEALAKPSTATKISEIIPYFSKAWGEVSN